jgi:predicted transcriptional regulator
MNLKEVLRIIEGRIISSEIDLDTDVSMACGADLLSDVLSFTHAGTLLMTGLTNPQVIRTAEMADIAAIVFVRGKLPPEATISLAESKRIPLLASKYTMYETCGRLYREGHSRAPPTSTRSAMTRGTHSGFRQSGGQGLARSGDRRTRRR